MKQKTELILDRRTTDRLHSRIKELAASYTPEWNFNTADPDIGSTLAMIYANQMSGNIRRLNQTIDKYHTEFVNLLGISLKPAYPASGVVVAEPVRSAVAGVSLPHGTRLVADSVNGDSTHPIIFETVSDVYVTGSRIRDIVSISGSFGKVIPLMGGPQAVSVLEKKPVSDDEEDFEQEYEQAIPPIPLFDFSDEGIEQHALMLYHQNVFDAAPHAEILIRIDLKNGVSPEIFTDPEQFEWSYFDGEDLAFFKADMRSDGCICLTRNSDSCEVIVDKTSAHLICLRAKKPLPGGIELTGIAISSSCDDASPDYVCANGRDVEIGGFMPFGDEASVFDECYIGCENIFHQKNSRVSINFHLDVREKLVTLTAQQEENLKIIKRKPHETYIQTALTSPQLVTLEYFNGIGWRRLVCDEDWSTLFDGTHTGDVTITFSCPEDWQPTAVGGYTSRCVRLRIVQADNCYLRPCKHTMPIISGLKLSYTYEDNWSAPQKLQLISGTKKYDVSQKLAAGEAITVFSPLQHIGNALYLGFDAPIEGAPVSILFNIEENVHFKSAPIAFEYSTISGFKPLRIIDNTRNMSSSGTVVFMPPSDFAAVEVEGVRRWWLRLVDERGFFDDPKRYHAVIRSIMLNAIEIRNIEYRAEEPFYIASASPDMSFPLSAQNILSAEVFVNEKDDLSQSEAKRMIQEHPQDVRVEYDFLGGIQSLYVRWSEVESFDFSQPGDRHYVIDRMNNRIIFGDGVHVRIPRAQNAVAFTVQCRCCRGEEANLPAGSVANLFENILYLNNIYNPIATYAGSSIEKLESAHLRGANMISGRGRLVSELDYEREVLAFSDAVQQVRCVAGMNPDGKSVPSAITLTILMRDYQNGAYSFRSIKDRLREHLFTRCEINVDDSSLILSEPIYVEITLDIWAVAQDAQRSFDVQNAIRNGIEDYLDPLGSHGWNIGELPTETQIRMMLHSLQGGGHINRYIITARYTDSTGSHDMPLDQIPANPFVIPVNGDHHIYMELPHSK